MIFDQLFESITELERAITTAKNALAKTTPSRDEFIQRLDSYEKILDQQRILAGTLCTHALRRNWGEVARHIRIIKALSQMIRDDAMEIANQVEPLKTVDPSQERIVQ